jgi:hypothetical protein
MITLIGRYSLESCAKGSLAAITASRLYTWKDSAELETRQENKENELENDGKRITKLKPDHYSHTSCLGKFYGDKSRYRRYSLAIK